MNDHLYVRIKNLDLDVKLGNQNKINDKMNMLKGFYIYKSKKINHDNYKQIDLVYNIDMCDCCDCCECTCCAKPK